jgi:cytochrome c oxidase subunit IV
MEDTSSLPPHTSQETSSHTSPPLRVYYLVYAALIVLLLLTMGAHLFDLGAWSLLIAMVIAIIKAVLVLLYFMHLRYSSRLVWLFAGAGLAWLFLIFLYTLSDYISRGWVGS